MILATDSTPIQIIHTTWNPVGLSLNVQAFGYVISAKPTCAPLDAHADAETNSIVTKIDRAVYSDLPILYKGRAAEYSTHPGTGPIHQSVYGFLERSVLSKVERAPHVTKRAASRSICASPIGMF